MAEYIQTEKDIALTSMHLYPDVSVLCLEKASNEYEHDDALVWIKAGTEATKRFCLIGENLGVSKELLHGIYDLYVMKAKEILNTKETKE